jgi:serine/threonine-protein kinase HipA
VDAGSGYDYWIMKFDGISNSGDLDTAIPMGYGKIEYAYHLMAVEAGIEMTACRLHHEGGRSHFMTKRFDRTAKGKKLHMQSLGAMAHFDYRQPESYSYEQAIKVIRRLELSRKDKEQLVLRAIFNVVSRNRDDHVKNIAFLMNQRGEWSLSPGFDISYAWNPEGPWTSKHQMSINGKRDDFEREDFIQLARTADIKKMHAEQMVQQVIDVVRRWPDFAEKAGVGNEHIRKIKNSHIINL